MSMTLVVDHTNMTNFMMNSQHTGSGSELHEGLDRNDSFESTNGRKSSLDSHGETMKSTGDSLMLRKTQGDLLQKLRQLRLWQQQQQEHFLQDKEKKLSMIRDQERKLQQVQEYQKRALAQSGHFRRSPTAGTSPDGQTGIYGDTLNHNQTHGSLGPASETIRHVDMNQNISMMNTSQGPSQLLPPSKTLLLSPKHFQGTLSSEENLPTKATILDSPDLSTLRPQNPMLLTQRIQLPVHSDDELSQFTDAGSISDIDGIQPIADTASEMSLDDDSNLNQFDEVNDGEESVDEENDECIYKNNESDQDETLINEENEEEFEKENKQEKYDEEFDEDGEQFEECLDTGDINTKPFFDEIPIKPGLGSQTKTFEELLDEKLQAERGNVDNVPNGHETEIPVKRTFLRKGEGIARFGLKEKKQQKKKGTQLQKKTEEEKSTLTRITAGANKVLVDIQESQPEKSNFPRKTARNLLSSRVIGPYNSIDVPLDTEIVKAPMGPRITSGTGGKFQKTIFAATGCEDSFQERMKKYDELDIFEKNELNEFELLEEAAANCSLSSNSSTVLRILGKKSEQDKNKAGRGNGWKFSTRSPSSYSEKYNASIVEEKFEGQEEDEVNDDSEEDDGNNTLIKSDDDSDKEETLKKEDIIIVHSSLSDGFNDSETWEHCDDLDLSAHNDPMMSMNTSTPDAKSSSRNASQRKLLHASSTPPTSNLVTKLFPQLKTKTSTQSKDEKLEPAINKKQSSQSVQQNKVSLSENSITSNTRLQDGGESSTSNAVKEKLQELEKEIEKFREENAMLHKLREERERELHDLQRERSLFESQKTEELEKLEKFKAEEERRLRRDKRVFEQYQKASRALPDKKEREEILSLKTQINEVQEEMKLRESRWSAAATRYKDRIANLEKENKEMKEEVRLLEKQNLELQKKEQQKTRELQQYKAFEKRKVNKPQEVPTKSSLPKITPQQVSEVEKRKEHVLQNDDKPKSSPASEYLKGQKKSSKTISDSSTPQVDYHDTQPRATFLPKKRIAATEIQPTKNLPTGNKRHNEEKQSPNTTTSFNDPPPSSKPNHVAKSVRFKDNETDQENDQPLLPKDICHEDGKRETINADGSRVVTFLNGTRKEISSDGLSTIVTFFNGDVKQIMPDERVVYYYSEAQTTHTTYPDGMQVLHFPSNQIEKHYPDGTKEIIFPDQTVKYLYQSGAEECVFADGTVERITGDGDRIIEFPNGQRETYTKLFKKREYPDGTVKTVFTDGRQETRYPSGRLRVKDSEGRLLVDTADQQVKS